MHLLRAGGAVLKARQEVTASGRATGKEGAEAGTWEGDILLSLSCQKAQQCHSHLLNVDEKGEDLWGPTAGTSALSPVSSHRFGP